MIRTADVDERGCSMTAVHVVGDGGCRSQWLRNLVMLGNADAELRVVMLGEYTAY